MSSYYHSPYVDAVTRWLAADMNSPIGQLDSALYALTQSIIDSEEISVYIVGMFWPGTPGNSQRIFAHPFTPVGAFFPANLTGSKASSRIAALASCVLSIKKNGGEVGTITFAVSSSTGVFASSGFDCAEGDLLTIETPASMDVDLEDIAVSLYGSKDTIGDGLPTTTTAPPVTTTTTVLPGTTTTTIPPVTTTTVPPATTTTTSPPVTTTTTV